MDPSTLDILVFAAGLVLGLLTLLVVWLFVRR